jgi:hypothetical protein
MMNSKQHTCPPRRITSKISVTRAGHSESEETITDTQDKLMENITAVVQHASEEMNT